MHINFVRWCFFSSSLSISVHRIVLHSRNFALENTVLCQQNNKKIEKANIGREMQQNIEIKTMLNAVLWK